MREQSSFDEDTAEQSYHIRGVNKLVGLRRRHAIFDISDKIVSPSSVLTTHMFLLTGIFLLGTLEQRFYGN